MRSNSLVRSAGHMRKSDSVAGGVSKTELAKLSRQVRALVDELMRGLLDAITASTAHEIGETIGALEEGMPIAVVANERPKRNGVVRSGPRSTPRVTASSRRQGAERSRPSMAPQSPFDITSPGDLLATVQAMGRRVLAVEENAAPPPAAAAAPPSAPELPPTLAAPPAPSSTSDIEAASERRPRVVLREGERLVSATGSGVVIRRDRRIAPRA